MTTGPLACERSLTINTGQRALEGRLAAPATATRAGAVLCHPHPEYGGSMDNAVVVTVAAALVAGGFATLRFNFGGVGQSEGAFSGGPVEIDDARAALGVLAEMLRPGDPIILVGYSFGAWVA